jgi:ribonuclease P protein component
MAGDEEAFKSKIEFEAKTPARVSPQNARKVRPGGIEQAKEKKARDFKRMKNRSLRLNKPSEFRQIFKEGRRFISPHFVLYVRENALGGPRIGVSVSKSHFKLATRRNRIRRVVKELLKKSQGNCDFVLASKAGCPGGNIKKALNEIRDLARRGQSG